MDLCQHVGIAYDSTLVLADSLAADDIPESYYMNGSEALMNRPEYHLLQASVKAEQLQTRMKLGEYLPSAGIGIGVENMKYDEGRDRTNGMIFGTVQVPLSGWWEASYALKERSVKEQIARNNLKENSELLGLQMEKAWQDLTDAYKQVSLSEEAKAQAEENMKVNADSYDNGLITVSDLLEAQALLRQAKDQLTDAKTSYRMKIVGYLNVTGRTPLQ
jgi:outer membrane protein TolC